MKRKILFLFFGNLIVALALTSGPVWAGKDDVRAKINQVAPNVVALTEGGNPLAQGTFSSSSSIKLQYELMALAFPVGMNVFGTFNLGVEILDNSASTGNATSYPVAVNIGQNGGDGPNLQLSGAPASYSNIAGPGFLGTSTVTITINCTLANPCPENDGDELVANLQFTGSPSSQLNSSVKIQVRVKLVHPSAATCLSVYNFLTDQGLTKDVSSTEVGVVKSGKNAGKVTATNPYGQFSDNVLVANTCAGVETFDLKITLDPSFDTNPNNNPGNAVFTYLAGEDVDPESFDINKFSAKTPQGQTLCLVDIGLDGGQTFLATVHMGIRNGMHQSLLSPSPFTFRAEIYPAGSNCAGEAEYEEQATMTYTLK